MKFSWKAILVAPLAAPFLFSLAVATDLATQRVAGFLCFLILGSILSYGTTTLLFVPSLFCFSKLTRLSAYNVCLLGLGLGMAIFFPLTFVGYLSSGPDSGPPQGTYWRFVSHSWSETFTWLFPLGGLITATAYWLLANAPSRTDSQPDCEGSGPWPDPAGTK
jgi:hypothetical protein